MDFRTGLNVIKFHVDETTKSIIKELGPSGIHLGTNHEPTFQPGLGSMNNKKFPVAWLILKWSLIANTEAEKNVLEYVAEDTHQINPHDLPDETITKIIMQSYETYNQELLGRALKEGIQVGIRQLPPSQCDLIRSDIKAYLKHRGF